MPIPTAGVYAADQQGFFGSQPTGPSFQDYVYSQGNQGYGINSQYLTPNYTAAYRPAYGGPTGEPTPYSGGGSFAQSAWYAAQALPFPGAGYGSQTPYYQSALGLTDYHSHNLASIGPDAATNLLQQYVAPVAAAYLAAKTLNLEPFYAKGFKRGAQTFFSMNTRESIAARAGGLMGKAAGGVLGGAAGATTRALVGMGSIGGGAAAFGAIGGLAGGLAGTVALPLLAGQAMYSTADTMVFDPYVQTRRGADALKANLYSTSMGSEAGSVTGGLGISSQKAYEISNAINQEAFKDFAFKDSDYTSMLDYSAQAGLFDSMKGSDYNATTMTKKIKDISSSVKQIMHVFGEKDMQEAIGILSKFSKMGFGPGTENLAASLTSIRATSAYVGKSAGEVFQSAYLPGAYAFQGQGLSAMVGGKNATDAYRGYEAALKNGLVDKDVLAALGGSEGASQLNTQASLRLASTQYNKLAAYNQAFLGRETTGVANNIQAFAKGMGTDPIRAVGNMALYGNQAVSDQLGKDPFAVDRQAIDVLNMIKPGKKNLADLAAVYTQTMGLSDEEAQARVLALQSTLKVDQSELIGQMVNTSVAQKLESEGVSFVNPTLLSTIRNTYVQAKNITANPTRQTTGVLAKVSDAFTKFGTDQQFALRSVDRSSKSDELALTFQNAGKVKVYAPAISKDSMGNAGDLELSNYVNKYAQSLDPRVRQAASQAFTSDGTVNVEGIVKLQKVTGDTSVSPTDVIAASKNKTKFVSKTRDYGSGEDFASRVTALSKKMGLEDMSLLTGYKKAEKEGPIALEMFIQENAESFKKYAEKNITAPEIKYSGAFAADALSGATGEGQERWAYYASTLAGGGYQQTDKDRVQKLKDVRQDSREMKDIASGVVGNLLTKTTSSKEGLGLYVYATQGAQAARGIFSAKDIKVSTTRDPKYNSDIVDGVSAAAAVGAASISTMDALKGYDYETGINLNDAMKTSNPFEKAGAMILKGANIIAATAEEEARRKGGGSGAPSPSPVRGTQGSDFYDSAALKSYVVNKFREW